MLFRYLRVALNLLHKSFIGARIYVCVFRRPNLAVSSQSGTLATGNSSYMNDALENVTLRLLMLNSYI